jgi:hypothetical protein
MHVHRLFRCFETELIGGAELRPRFMPPPASHTVKAFL